MCVCMGVCVHVCMCVCVHVCVCVYECVYVLASILGSHLVSFPSSHVEQKSSGLKPGNKATTILCVHKVTESICYFLSVFMIQFTCL